MDACVCLQVTEHSASLRFTAYERAAPPAQTTSQPSPSKGEPLPHASRRLLLTISYFDV